MTVTNLVSTAPPVDMAFPAGPPRRAAEILADLDATPPLEPFAPAIVEFFGRLADTVRRAGRGHPELQALAFWMRRAELGRIHEEFRALNRDDVVLIPRGTVLHIAPSNVDTIFVYSWVLAALVGNRNIIRLSQRRSAQTELLVQCLRDTAAALPDSPVPSRTAVVTYGHEDAVTSALSAGTDMRVVWGGDATVRRMREFPLAPRAVELTFPDRSSLAVLSATAIANLTDDALTNLAERFFNDAYWFDQMGCSSPRAVVWIGDCPTVNLAALSFYDRLAAVIDRKGYRLDARGAIDKLLFQSRAVLDGRAIGVTAMSNELLILQTEDLGTMRGEFCGRGTIFNLTLRTLDDVATAIARRDQTLAHFGFSHQELTRLARQLNGRGIDRMVPVGEALDFHRFWDGHDLLQALTRRIHVRAEAPLGPMAGSMVAR